MRHIELEHYLAADRAQLERDLRRGNKGAAGTIRVLAAEGYAVEEIARLVEMPRPRVREILRRSQEIKRHIGMPSQAGIGTWVTQQSVRRALSINKLIDERTIRKWLAKGKVRTMRVGGRIVVNKQDLDHWIATNVKIRERMQLAEEVKQS